MTVDTRVIRIASRFCGPPGRANGGCIAGLMAAGRDEAFQVTLRRPIPLETDLRTESAGSVTRLLHEGRLLAEAEPCELALPVPAAPGHAEAVDATSRYVALRDHPFPECFACGTARREGDGLRLFAGPVDGRALVATPWVPDASVVDAAGLVHPFVLWAALDCPGAYADMLGRPAVPQVLGRIAAHIAVRPRVGDRLTVIGWPIVRDGPKHHVGTAIIDATGRVLARARATWFEFTSPVAGPPGAGAAGE